MTNDRLYSESSFLDSARHNNGALSLSARHFDAVAIHVLYSPSPTKAVLVWGGGMLSKMSWKPDEIGYVMIA